MVLGTGFEASEIVGAFTECLATNLVTTLDITPTMAYDVRRKASPELLDLGRVKRKFPYNTLRLLCFTHARRAQIAKSVEPEAEYMLQVEDKLPPVIRKLTVPTVLTTNYRTKVGCCSATPTRAVEVTLIQHVFNH